MLRTELVLVGSSGHAREVLGLVEDLIADGALLELLGFVDDHPESDEVHGYPVLGGLSWLEGRPEVAVSVAIGQPESRLRVVTQLEASGHGCWATLVHPTARVSPHADLGSGTTVCAAAEITTDTTVGAHVLINRRAGISHDSELADFVTVAPGANLSGGMVVGEGANIGTGVSTVQYRTIGEWSTIGAGAVVTTDIAPNATAVGVPAKVVSTSEPGWQYHPPQ
jgi:sugar O-acyltransferase (sialic acid O-acetyltransferase NeuD family)